MQFHCAHDVFVCNCMKAECKRLERSPGFKRPKKVFIASPLALEVKIKVEGLSLENMPFTKRLLEKVQNV